MANEQTKQARSAGEFFPRFSGREVRHDRYALVVVLILITILSEAVLGDGVWGLLLTLVLMTLTLAVTLRTSDAGERALLIGSIASVATLIAIATALITQNLGPARLAYGFAMLVLTMVTPFVIARRLLSHNVVNLSTVTGAAAIYLLIGLMFSVFYSLIGTVLAMMWHAPNASVFFIASRPLGPSDFPYYSFVTLTTVGYGDIIASVPFGRMLSVCEALIGQLYLVTVLAVLVANIGRSRRTQSDDSLEELMREED